MTPETLNKTDVESYEKSVRSFAIDAVYFPPLHEVQGDAFKFEILKANSEKYESLAEDNAFAPYTNVANWATAIVRNAFHVYAGRKQVMSYGLRSASNSATVPYTVVASMMTGGSFDE